VNQLEGAVALLRASLAAARQRTLDPPGISQTPAAHYYAALPDPTFPSPQTNRSAYEAVCGGHLAALGARQRRMLTGEAPPPVAVLVVLSPLESEGIADFFKQVRFRIVFRLRNANLPP
jgi:hypothetical protein